MLLALARALHTAQAGRPRGKVLLDMISIFLFEQENSKAHIHHRRGRLGSAHSHRKIKAVFVLSLPSLADVLGVKIVFGRRSN